MSNFQQDLGRAAFIAVATILSVGIAIGATAYGCIQKLAR